MFLLNLAVKEIITVTVLIEIFLMTVRFVKP